MSITYKQAADLLSENYSPAWSWDDPEWWAEMIEALMEYPSVKRLRHPLDPTDTFGGPEWRIPKHWPGQTTRDAR